MGYIENIENLTELEVLVSIHNMIYIFVISWFCMQIFKYTLPILKKGEVR